MLKLAIAFITTLALAGCSTFQALPSVQNKDETPRSVGVMLAQDIDAPIAELADACEAGLLSPTTIDIVDRYAGTIRTVVGTYAASARPCIVEDGGLRSDVAAGDTCFRGDVKTASLAIPRVLKDVGLAVGGDRGRQLYTAGILATSLVGRNDGGVIDGFKKTDDVPLEIYDQTWAPIAADADRLQECAANPPARSDLF